MTIRRWSPLSAVFVLACTSPPPPGSQATVPVKRVGASSACLASDELQPLLPPGAARIEARGMATTINPGMNVDEQHYRVETMSVRDVEAFYGSCLGPAGASGTFTESVRGSGAAAHATRTYDVRREADVTVVRVRCERCY